MYQKKLYLEKSRYSTGDPIPFLAASSKFTDAKEPIRSVHKGKQFVVTWPKETKAAQEGLFRKFGYESSPFADAISYKNAPKKLGFYSGAPPMRDEFSGTQATQRYREKIQHEYRSTHRQPTDGSGPLAASTSNSDLAASATGANVARETQRLQPFERLGEDVRASIPATTFDHIHEDHTRPDWQKTSRDRWFHNKLRPIEERRRMGQYSLTSDAYGYGTETMAQTHAPASGKRSADFFFRGHVEANGAHF